MAILQSCCFWKTVRKGSFASAAYTLIYFGFSSFVMLVYIREEHEFLSGESTKPTGESILARGDITPAIVIFNILFLGCSVLLVVSSILVIVGLRQDKRELLLPWIIFMLCDVLIELAHLVYLSITQMVNFDPVVGFLFTIDFFIMCLNSYCLLCVISQYQNYQQGRGYGNGSIQMRAEATFRTPQNLKNAEDALNRKASKHKPVNITITKSSHRHANFTTIPEEVDQNHRLRCDKADINAAAAQDNETALKA